ncbi:hypothetical protein Tco_0674647 [Tanacetum coccineum]
MNAQRRFLAEQRAAAIRNRPPTRTQLRSQMMTYLKHVGNKKHSDLKNKTFEEIQGASNPEKKKKIVKEDVLTKVPVKPDVAEQGTKKRKGGHMKMLARKRKRPQPDVDSNDEHRKCLNIVTFEGTIDSEIIERKYVIARLNKVSSQMDTILLIYRPMGTSSIQAISWRRIAKDVKETLRSYQDLSECLNTSSMKFKESTQKKHEVKQVQQSCLGEDHWELYIHDLVPNSMAGSEDDIPPPPPPPSQTPTQQTPHTVSTIKLPILKKGEYDIWAMKMEHYLAHTDYPIWEVIQRGNCPMSVSTDTNGLIKVLPPKTAKEILARERERKARTTFLMALLEDHLAKFHKMTDAKDMWEAIKSRFGGNDESKKMQKSLPSAWSQVSLIMRTKPGVDNLNFDDLYNNLRVFEFDVKGSTASSSNT